MSARFYRTLTLSTLTSSILLGCGVAQLPLQGQYNQRLMPQKNMHTLQQADEQMIEGRLIVKYRPGTRSALSSTLSQVGAKRIKSIGSHQFGVDVLQLQPGQSPTQVLQKLKQHPGVLYAEPEFTIPFPTVMPSRLKTLNNNTPSVFPNDAMFSDQYSHKITESQKGWQVNQGSENVVLGIVDSGVDITHPDLKDKIVGTHNSADNTDEVVDQVGHGTHVAGIAAASTNNQLGVAGVCANCKILAVKVASKDSPAPSTSGIANGILWAADHGAQVINLSLGGRRQAQVITDAVNYALSKNVVVVVAMGNDGANIKNWPAAVPGVVAVGSTDSSDKRSSFSNFGDWISVGAPGSTILSTFPLNDNMIGQKEYGSISGTSMATPFVTGLAGLVRSQNSQLTQTEVKQLLEETADDRGDSGFDPQFGHGRVNVGNALTKLSAR